MFAEYKTIIDDLLQYTIHGIHDGTTALLFNGVSFDSTVLNGIKYQFISKYEDVEIITDNTIIPVLVIKQPEQYLQGRLLYKEQFVDLRTMVVKENKPKINFFVIPHLTGMQGHNLGDINFDLKIDYITDFDTYGFMSKEIDSILKLHYFKRHRGDYYNIQSPHTGQLQFVPTSQRFTNQQSIINRVAQSFNIKFCAIV